MHVKLQELQRVVHQLPDHRRLPRLRGLKIKKHWLKRMKAGKWVEVRKHKPEDKKTQYQRSSATPPRAGDRILFLAEGKIWGSGELGNVRTYRKNGKRAFKADAADHHITKKNCPASGEYSYEKVMESLESRDLYGWEFLNIRWHAPADRPTYDGDKSAMQFHTTLFPANFEPFLTSET